MSKVIFWGQRSYFGFKDHILGSKVIFWIKTIGKVQSPYIITVFILISIHNHHPIHQKDTPLGPPEWAYQWYIVIDDPTLGVPVGCPFGELDGGCV